ncbi:MAG: TonB-dependent receptor [Saprospiraceae bacterium]|nr:TonB-dependent receptor [Saprospiraceae bacterium]
MQTPKWVVLALIVLFPLFSWGQDCQITLQGKVLDEHDQTPLEFSSVFLLESGKGVLADSTGYYRMDGLCPGRYTLIASHVGCDPVEIQINLTSDTTIDLFPEHHIELLETVVTTAFKVSEAPSQTRSELSGLGLERLQGRSLAQMLSGISGVNVVRTGPGIGKPMIHGLYGNRILIVQNDVRQEGQQWGIDHAPEIDPTVAGKLTVIKGAEGVRYGPDALGGVILVTPDPLPRSAGIQGTFLSEAQSNGWGGKLATTIQGGMTRPGWGWRTTGSIKVLGDATSPRYMLTNTGVREAGLSAQVGFTGNKTTFDVYYSLYRGQFGILRAAHIGNLTDLEAAIESSEPWYQRPFGYGLGSPRQDVVHHLAKVEASRQLSHMWTIKGRYSVQYDERKEYDVRRGDDSDRPALDMVIISQQADALLEHRSWRHLKGTFGTSLQYQTNYNIAGTGIRPLIPNYITTTAAAYGIERYVRENYELEAGLRLDYRYQEISRYNDLNVLESPSREFTNVNFSLGGLYRFGQRWTAVLNAGTAFRAPGVNELYSQGLHHATASIEKGDDRLTLEKGLKTVGTIGYKSEKFDFDLSAYANLINGYIYLNPDEEYALTIRGAFPVFQYEQTDVLIYGTDVSVRYALLENLQYTGQASLLWAEDHGSDQALFGMPPMQFRHNLTYRLNIGGYWQLLEADIGARQVLRQYRAPAYDYAEAPPAYFLFSTALTAAYRNKRFILGVDNLLNTAYRDYLDRLRYFADGPGRNVYFKFNLQF